MCSWARRSGSDAQCFVVHVGDRTSLGEKFGVAGSVARIDGDGASGRGSETRGEILPVRDGAESFVEENEFRRVRVDAGNTVHFEAASLHRNVEGATVFFRVAHIVGFQRLHRFSVAALATGHFSDTPAVFLLHRTSEIS